MDIDRGSRVRKTKAAKQALSVPVRRPLVVTDCPVWPTTATGDIPPY